MNRWTTCKDTVAIAQADRQIIGLGLARVDKRARVARNVTGLVGVFQRSNMFMTRGPFDRQRPHAEYRGGQSSAHSDPASHIARIFGFGKSEQHNEYLVSLNHGSRS